MTAVTREMKLPRFDSTSPWLPYVVQLRLAAQNCGCDDREAATRLALAFEGPVFQTLLDIDPDEQGRLSMLTNPTQIWAMPIHPRRLTEAN